MPKAASITFKQQDGIVINKPQPKAASLTFEQQDGIVINKPMGVIGKSIDLRSQISDGKGGRRDYLSTTEVLTHLVGDDPAHTAEIRKGHFPIYVTPVGQPMREYYFSVEGQLMERTGIPGPQGPPSTVPGPAGPPSASESLNIRTLGVTGNGTDESQAVKAAILTANGRPILIENITIKMKAIIIAGGPRIDLQGVNATIQMLPEDQLTNNGTYYHDRFWFIAGVNGVKYTGIEWDMQSAPGGPTSGTAIQYISNCTNVTVTGNYAHDNGHAGFIVVDSHFITFAFNHISNTDSGIFILGASDNIHLVFNTIHGGTSEGLGIFNSSNDTLATRWEIIGNIIYDKGGFAINCNAAYNGVVSSNHATNCLGLLMLYDSGSGNPATRHSLYNSVTGNQTTGCDYGIVNVGSGTTVTANHFKDISYFALGTNNYTDSNAGVDPTPSVGVVITGNHFNNVGYGSTGTAGPALWLYNLRDSSISGNQFHNCTSYQGMKLEKCENLSIMNNNGPTLNLHPVAGTDYSKKMLFVDNTFSGSHVGPPLPFTGLWNWEFRGTRFVPYDSDPTNAFYQLQVNGGVADSLNTEYIRTYYRVVNSATITSMVPSWADRLVTLISNNGQSFTMTNGGNLVLGAASRVISNGASIALRYDQVNAKWRELYLAL